MPFCSRCGRELLPNSKFCMHCGTSINAPIPPPPAIPPSPAKPSHINRNIAIVVIFIIVVGIFAAASSGPRLETTTQTATPVLRTETPITTATPLPQGSIIRLGQPLILKEGYPEIPVEITFTAARFTTKYGYYEADKGYEFLVLEITSRNVGMKETDCFHS